MYYAFKIADHFFYCLKVINTKISILLTELTNHKCNIRLSLA